MSSSSSRRLRAALLIALPALAAGVPLPALAAVPLTVAAAIRSAWSRNEGLRASASSVEAARAEADRAALSRLPSLSLSAKGIRTDEPMMAFGAKVDQGRIGPADFDPARLNDPPAIGGFGAGATVSLPLFAGGRLLAGTRAAGAMADAEAATHARRRDELAAAVVHVYFGAQAAEEGMRHAKELLAQATETERFVRQRAAQGLALEADVARAAAFRAQAQAERATAVQRLATARSGLALLAGAEAEDAELVSPVEAPATEGGAPAPPPALERADLQAARLQREAAEQGVKAARGSLLPGLFAMASAETLRTADLDEGTAWTTLALVARWDLSLADGRAVKAARARARAAGDALAWREREAARETGEARRAIEAGDLRVRAAEEAVAAATQARALREARHRQGLLPLTDVLDAETALAGARALLLSSRLEARVARARLALALAQPIEGIAP